MLLVGLGCEANGLGTLITARRLDLGRAARGAEHPGDRRHAPLRRGGRAAPHRDASGHRRGGAGTGRRLRAHRGAAVRWVGWVLGRHRQPGARRCGRPPGGPRRHRDPVGDARDLRRRAPAHPSGRHAPRSGRSCSTGSPGGRTTPPATTARWTTTRSPGNKAGGLTTIYEKSLGAVAKGGTTGLMEVYEYADTVSTSGLVFMDTPGYDPVSATGQVAGGANLICFTTGRGSAYGCIPSPSIKLATNSALFARQADDIDINCGEMLDLDVSAAEMGQRIFAEMLRVASGEARPRARHSATARTSSRRGSSAPPCERSPDSSLRAFEMSDTSRTVGTSGTSRVSRVRLVSWAERWVRATSTPRFLVVGGASLDRIHVRGVADRDARGRRALHRAGRGSRRGRRDDVGAAARPVPAELAPALDLITWIGPSVGLDGCRASRSRTTTRRPRHACSTSTSAPSPT